MLDIKFSTVYGYALLYDKDKIYLVNTIYSKALFNLSKDAEKTTLEAYQIDQQEATNLEANKKGMGTLSAVLITQPIATLIYNFGKYTFKNYGISDSIAVKLLLLMITLFITLLLSRFFQNSREKKYLNIFLQIKKSCS